MSPPGTHERPSLDLLLVEDDEVDVLAMRRALAACAPPHRLHVASDGQAALAVLRLRPVAAAARWLVLLDLNLPRMGGLELLAALRADAALASVPVVVLTTSGDGGDIRAAFRHQVAGFFRKPLDPAQAAATMSTITAYWTLSELP